MDLKNVPDEDAERSLLITRRCASATLVCVVVWRERRCRREEGRKEGERKVGDRYHLYGG